MGSHNTLAVPGRGTLHLAVALTLAAGIGFGAWRISSQNDKVFRENFRRQLSDISELKINQLMAWQAERKGDSLVAMSSADLMSDLESALKGESPARAGAVRWLAGIRKSYGYAGTEILDQSGSIRIADGASLASPQFYRDLAAEAAHSAKLVFRYFPRADKLSRSVFAACVPLRNRAGVQFASLVLIVDPWLSPFPELLKWPSATRTGRLFLVRREGADVRVIGANLSGARAKPDEFLVNFSRSASPFPRAFLLQEGPIDGLDETGHHVTGFVRHLPIDDEEIAAAPGRPMAPVMLALMEDSEAFALRRQNEFLLLAAAALLIILCAAGVGWIWRQQALQFYRQQLKSEQERRALIGHYDFLTRFANDAVFLADSRGAVLQVNERASDFYGYTRDEMIGMNVQEFRAQGTEGDYERARERIEKQGRFVFESIARRKDGSVFPVELSVRVIEAEGEKYRQTIVRDITERRRSEQQIERLNRLYAVLSRCGQAIVKAQDEAELFREVVNVAVDSGGFSIAAIRTAEKPAEKMTLTARAGASAEYLDAMAVLPESVASSLPPGKSIGASGALVCNDLWHEGAAEARRFNVRSHLCLPLWCSARLSGELLLYSPEPDFFNGEELALATEVAENLSFALESFERKRKQQSVEGELRSNRERLEMVLDATEEAYWDWDLESGEILQSPRYDEMLGYGAYEVPRGYQDWLSLVHPEDAGRVAQEFSLFSASGKDMYANEFRMRSRSGEYIWISCRAKAVRRSSQGAPKRLVGTLTDVTDRKKLEEQFRQSQKLESVGRLAGGVAHDFNNLLTVINGYSRLLIRNSPEKDPRLKQLKEIRKAGEKAAELTKQLLTFSRKNISEPRLLHLNAVAGESETMLRRLTPDHIEFVASFNAQQDEVLIDPSHVQQILMNLVVNASDAMPAGGRVTLRTSNVDSAQGSLPEQSSLKRGLWLLLEVSDTGVGMDEDTLHHIFEPFFTTKEVGKGTGLGLSTVYGIVQQCGGTVRVESRPGAGTTFRIYLPVASEGILPGSGTKAPEVTNLSGTETILAVEDQDDVREFTENALRTYGYTVISARSGDEALEAAKRHSGPIHLLITDVMMPGANGWTVARELRRIRPEVKVMFVSGYMDDVPRDVWEGDSDAEFLGKPFSPEVLADKVRRMLNKSAVRRTVLIIEDDTAVRELFVEFLGKKHTVLLASDGKEALEIVNNVQTLDLVITDMVLPNQPGAELIREIRRTRPVMRIIAMSGAFSGRFLKTAELLGADATLVKPIRPEVLEQLIEDVCGQAQPVQSA